MTVLDTDQQELWLVDRQTGELISRDPSSQQLRDYIAKLEGDLANAERDLRGKRARVSTLEGQLDMRPETYDRRVEVEEIVGEWRQVCGHPNARLTPDRFDCVRRLLEVTKPKPYERRHFSLAFVGAAHDPFVTRRKNGTEQKHDDLTHICKHFEEFIKRGPLPTEGRTA